MRIITSRPDFGFSPFGPPMRYTPPMHLETQSIDQTLALGRLLGQLAPAMPAVNCLALDGPLGAGKTHLTRGIALGAAVEDPSLVSSPTYVLMNIYEGGKRLYHLDAYRVESPAAFEEIGLDEILAGETGGGIVVIEWAARVRAALPDDTLWIAIDHAGDNARTLDLTAGGPQSRLLLEQIQRALAPNG